MGLGSSAAVAVSVSFALLTCDEVVPSLDLVFRTALRAHRAAQGGRGSGYDIAASTFGGIGLFQGGLNPRYDRLSVGPDNLLMIMGDRSLATPTAVGCYETWTKRRPDQQRVHRCRSNSMVRCALRDGRWGEAFEAGRRLTQWLGAETGIAVEPPELRERIDRVVEVGHAAKPVGAGGELAVCVPTPGVGLPVESWLRPVSVSPAGVKIE